MNNTLSLTVQQTSIFSHNVFIPATKLAGSPEQGDYLKVCLEFLINRWRALKIVLLLPPTSIEFLVMAALTLHNFLKKGPSRNIYCPPDVVDYEDARTCTVYPGQWCHDGVLQTMLPLPTPSKGHHPSTEAKEIRNTFKDYFFNEGAVSWQWDICM